MTCPWKKLAIGGVLLLSVVTSAPASAGLFGNWGANRACCRPICPPVCSTGSVYGPSYAVGYAGQSSGNCCGVGGCANGNCGVRSYYGPVLVGEACCNTGCVGGNCNVDTAATPTSGSAARPTPVNPKAEAPPPANDAAEPVGTPAQDGMSTFRENGLESNSNKPAAGAADPAKTAIEPPVKPKAPATPRIPDDGGFAKPKPATEESYDDTNPAPAAKPEDKNAGLRKNDDAEFPRFRPTVNVDDKVAWKPEAVRQRLTVRPTLGDARLVRAAAYPGYRNMAKSGSGADAKVAKK